MWGWFRTKRFGQASSDVSCGGLSGATPDPFPQGGGGTPRRLRLFLTPPSSQRVTRPTPAPKDWPDRLILFDGVCVLCNASVHQVLLADRAKRFSFASMQSPFGRALATAVGIDPDRPDSVAVRIGDRVLFKSDAALAVMRELEGRGWTGVFRIMPRVIRDTIYDRVARNRYAWFGKTDRCIVPKPEDRGRFLDDRPPPA